ncbi:MAG: hypothetical protein IH987_00845 [Planctomycetes bacterium]|nr:hypothetical protein [Planctomycetota bacterium]
MAGAPRSRRRTVRIVEPRSTTRTAVVSFLITAAAAMFALVIWLSLRPAVVEGPVRRVLPEVDLDWRCDAGHAWRARGQIEPRVCMTKDCDRDMWPAARWSCENHHKFHVATRLELDASGFPGPVEFRLRGHKWVVAGDPLVCPKCSKFLREDVRDPLADVKRRKRRSAPPPKRGG